MNQKGTSVSAAQAMKGANTAAGSTPYQSTQGFGSQNGGMLRQGSTPNDVLDLTGAVEGDASEQGSQSLSRDVSVDGRNYGGVNLNGQVGGLSGLDYQFGAP